MKKRSAMTSNPSLDHWARYWQSGARHSLPHDFIGNYDREMATFWNAHFSKVSSGGGVLDVCTGTGAIALLARDALSDDSVRISAVDGAAVDLATLDQIWPDRVGDLQDIEFVFSCPLERMHELGPKGPFDLVTSQYGLEYCDLAIAGPMIASALKPGGYLAMVTHAGTSEMAGTMAEEAADYQLLEDQGYFKLLSSWSKNQLSGQDLAKRLQKVAEALLPFYQRSQSPLLAQVIESTQVALSQPVGQLMSQHQHAAAYLDQLTQAKARLDDMLRVTRLVGDDASWLQPLTNSGLKLLEQTEIRVDGEHLAGLGWVLQKGS